MVRVFYSKPKREAELRERRKREEEAPRGVPVSQMEKPGADGEFFHHLVSKRGVISDILIEVLPRVTGLSAVFVIRRKGEEYRRFLDLDSHEGVPMNQKIDVYAGDRITGVIVSSNKIDDINSVWTTFTFTSKR